MKKKKYLLLLLCLLVLATGCKRVPKLENGQEVIVEIDGKSFTADEFFDELKENYGTGVLVNMVDKFITEKEITEDLKKDAAKSAKVDYDYYYAYYGAYWDDFLSRDGFKNSDELLNQLEISNRQNLVLKEYVKTLVTEEEIKKYYNDKIDGEMNLRHILIKAEITDSMSTEEKAKAKEEALQKTKDLIEKLNVEDVENKFIELAKEYSKDTTASNGGLLENITAESGLVDPFYNASKKLEVGKYTTEPVETQYGYHIIYKVSQAEKPSLESVRDNVINKVAENLLSAKNATYIYWAGLREKYNMNIIDDTIKDNYNNAMSQYQKN